MKQDTICRICRKQIALDAKYGLCSSCITMPQRLAELEKLQKENEPELLPCPFCGGEARILSFFYCGNESRYYSIECSKCGNKNSESNSRSEAIASWNRRTHPAPQWSTEQPKDEGWYQVLYSGKHVDCIEVTTGHGKYESYRLGLYEEPDSIGEIGMRFCSIEDYIIKYQVTGWCKIDFPPRRKERRGLLSCC